MSIRKPTILDVARRAGVSVGTVSNVVNARQPVSDELKARVDEAIQTLGYRPNGLAQGLRRQRSAMVGLCVPHTSSAYFSALVEAFEEDASRRGYEMLQVLTHQEPERELRRIDALLARQVDGLILVPSGDPHASFERIAAARVPAVLVDRRWEGSRFDSVTIDDRAAMAEATRALIERGHREILFMVNHPGLVTTAARIEGFRSVAGKGARLQVGTEGLEAALRGPTAVIASNSMLALALMRTVRALGLHYPADLSILVFDEPEWSQVLEPPLAVVRHPTEAIAKAAWGLLIDRMHGIDGPRRDLTLAAELVLRDSVRRLDSSAGR